MLQGMHMRCPQLTQAVMPLGKLTLVCMTWAADVNLHIVRAPVSVNTEVCEVPSEEGPGDNHGVIMTSCSVKTKKNPERIRSER